ncbi:MAG: hypothetical protein JNK94_01555 [Hyphomonadaceae bacterium]|nr:hypothetical protein [Hyphomonadaceae bacterium]MBX3510303.1 hypothetical protein [Hyphomonadaceae bacterium]
MTLTRRMLFAGALAAAALTASCATGGLVSGDLKSGDATVTLAREWSDVTFMLPNRPPNVRMLSVDGPLLNRLYLANLEPGQSLLRLPDRDTPRPLYRADMSESELVEFVIDCIAQEYQNPEAAALRPHTLGETPAVRFDISTRTAEGLNISGTAMVARQNDRLHVLLYLAPSEHYYASLAPDVESVFASARLSPSRRR